MGWISLQVFLLYIFILSFGLLLSGRHEILVLATVVADSLGLEKRDVESRAPF